MRWKKMADSLVLIITEAYSTKTLDNFALQQSNNSNNNNHNKQIVNYVNI